MPVNAGRLEPISAVQGVPARRICLWSVVRIFRAGWSGGTGNRIPICFLMVGLYWTRGSARTPYRARVRVICRSPVITNMA